MYFFLFVINILYRTSMVSSKPDEIQLLNEQQLETLKNQYNRLRCIVMRQMAYATTTYQTKAMSYLLSEGQSVTLDSWLCLLPHQVDQVTVHWKFLSLEGAAITYIEESGDKYFIQGNNKRLTIGNVKVEDTGFYFANIDFKTDVAAYFIEISNDDATVTTSHLSYSKFYDPPEIIIPNLNLMVFIRMGEWTPCSRCDHIGVKYRSGTCYVKPHKNDLLRAEKYSIFDLFIEGLPCRSQFLPLDIRHMQQVKDTRSIIMKSFCRKPCATASPPEKAETGKWMTANDLIKNRFFNIREPLRSKIIRQKTIFQIKNKGVIITCPKRMDKQVPIIWKRDNTYLIPERLQLTTKNRIIIDPAGKIRIERSRLQDSGKYSCWQNERQIGIVLLIIQDRLDLPEDATYIITLLSYAAIALVVIIFVCNVIASRQRERT